MNILHQHNTAALPTKIVYQPACIGPMPLSVEIGDLWNNGGSGIGYGSEAAKSALGEYFERRHFYMEILPDKTGTLDTHLSNDETGDFINAFAQTRDNNIPANDIAQHNYHLTKVCRTTDFSICHVPTVCISLSAHHIESDCAIYPRRDTCGCSFHWDPMLAIFGSLKEQLERQFLLRFWLTKKCRKVVESAEVLEQLKSSKTLKLYTALTQAGELTVIDILDRDFPGTCLLTVYGSDDCTRRVKYCAGMAYAETTEAALTKSILELWQTYRFMDLHHATLCDTDEIEDPYLVHFLNCNTHQTYQDICNTHVSHTPKANQTTPFTTNGLLDVLSKLNIHGFVYIKMITFDSDHYFASKYFSPHLFLHMNNSQNINFNNTYSAQFSHEVYVERRNMMVPFP
ncbi:YcaO-like family protein [Pseudomonas sp. NPDC086278]|uniref:YcaO-like family protein n=1 Tax=Pseudomonas sp. NPDC086278 TaxID=3390646 RepID=UPI003D05C251